MVGLAVVLAGGLAGAVGGPAGLVALDEIPAERAADYQPWWAARGHLLVRLQRTAEAEHAFIRAASLTEDPALRAYLLKRAAPG